jgi:hypothetical protein
MHSMRMTSGRRYTAPIRHRCGSTWKNTRGCCNTSLGGVVRNIKLYPFESWDRIRTSFNQFVNSFNKEPPEWVAMEIWPHCQPLSILPFLPKWKYVVLVLQPYQVLVSNLGFTFHCTKSTGYRLSSRDNYQQTKQTRHKVLDVKCLVP